MQKPFRLFSSLPWITALAALGVYLATLNTFVSVSSLATANEVAQWEPVQQTTRPLLWLATRPAAWLGGSAQFFTMNLLSAVFAALTLAQLVRTVSILPHDRTRDQRSRESHEKGLLSIPLAWAPPVVAALVCAFQLKFWEHATVMTGEMLDLLVFAFCIRCLMEYRLDGKDRWLNLLAFVYGAGVTNNAAMIGFFPLFLGSLIWIRGAKFFQFPFLARMTGLGIAGLGFYLLLPVVAAIQGTNGVTFWDALKTNLAMQKQVVAMPISTIPILRLRFILMSMTSLVPLVLIGFRWKSLTTETSSIGRNLLSVLFVVASIGFVAAGIAGSFAMPFGPFELGYQLFAYLPVYYLVSLVVGYYLGYLLLVLLTEPEARWQRSQPATRFVGLAVGYVALVAALIAPVLLALESIRAVRMTNGPALLRTMQAKLVSLPETRAAVLSDDGSRLTLLRAAMQKTGNVRNHVLLDTGSLRFTNAFNKLAARHADLGSVWPTNPSLEGTFDDPAILKSVQAIQQKIPLFYLHPSFGYFFEAFQAIPNGGLIEMRPYAKDILLPPPPSAEALAKTAAHWDKLYNEAIASLETYEGPSSLDVAYLKRMLSVELADWGVTLQRAGNLTNAAIALKVAVDLKPSNPMDAENPGNHGAQTTLDFNRHLQNPNSPAPQLSETWSAIIDDPAQLQQAINAFGPVDEPRTLTRAGSLLSDSRYTPRQALICLTRAAELDPNDWNASLALAKAYLNAGFADRASSLAKEIRMKFPNVSSEANTDLLVVDALVLANIGKLNEAEALLRNALNKDNRNEVLQAKLIELYVATGQLERAIDDLDRRLAKESQPEELLLFKAMLLTGANRFSEALVPLEEILNKHPDNSEAIQTRALALVSLNRLPEAKLAYENLLKLSGKPLARAYFGLTAIALLQKDNKEAIKQSELYLKHAPKGTREYVLMKGQLEELKKQAP